MKNDLISREALRKAFHERIWYFDKSSWDEANAIIDNAPTVCGNNPKWCESCVSKGKCASTRVQGEWIFLSPDEPMKVECPFCHERKCCVSNYCDYCGAKMKGGAE